MKISEVIFNTRAILRQFTDDAKPSDRMIYSRLKANRASFITKALNKGDRFDGFSMQTLVCVPTKRVDASECCNVCTGAMFSRGVYKLPTPLETNNSNLTFYTIERGDTIDILDLNTFISQRNRKYKYPAITGFIENQYPYTEEDVAGFRVSGWWYSPEEIQMLNERICIETGNCGDITDPVTCYTPILEMEFFCPGDIQEAVENKTAKDIAGFYGVATEDKTNDASNTPPIK